MGELNKIRFLLIVSLLFFPAHAFDAIISGAHRNFKQRFEIKTDFENGDKRYAGTVNPLTYEARNGTTNVIVYIIDRSRYVEIIRNAVRGTRLQIARKLRHWNYELVFLGIENFDDDEHHLIGAFILEKIQPHPSQKDHALIIEVIGENRFNRSYEYHVAVFERYQEKPHICGGTLLACLRAIQHGALRPVESNNNKYIKLLEYLLPDFSIEHEVTWSVRVENDTYFPETDNTTPEHNINLRHPDSKINFLVLGGKEYSMVTSYGSQSTDILAMKKYLRKMAKNNEVFYMMGAFNFDWYDVYLVAQIILKHTHCLQGLDYGVSACGFGMFDTQYLNPNEGRYIQQPQDDVLKIRKELLGETKNRSIFMQYSVNGRKTERVPICMVNGHYDPVDRFKRYTFPWVNQKIAFIVYGSTEVNDPVDYLTVYRSVDELRRSNIFVVVIETINFGPYDTHIIAEWIEQHRGKINPKQIAVMGCGTFDTIFQSKCTTYNTFFNVGKNEMRTIRNAYVKLGNAKNILVANIDDANFKVWSYPMNTVVNGVYEPDLIPDKNMFDTSGGRGLFFIITNARNFQMVSAIPSVGLVTATFRETIIDQYPKSNWSVYLVGLDNFRLIDAHRIAELVNSQTADARPLAAFVRVINYDNCPISLRYKDTKPFPSELNPQILTRITWLFRIGA